nr:EOG090X03EV [Macrothrix elegans]
MADPLETESAEALLSFKNGGYAVKRELDFEGESDQSNQIMTLGPEMFGLKRITDVTTTVAPCNKGIGSTTNSPIMLNRRGIPARIRKKNPLFFGDDNVVEQISIKSPRKCSRAIITGSVTESVTLTSHTPGVKGGKKGQTRSAPGSTATTPERRGGSLGTTPDKSTLKIKPKLKKVKIKPSFRLTDKPKADQESGGRKLRISPMQSLLPSISRSSLDQDPGDLKQLGVRLRNLLKLPKAHKWVCYEWFYSNLDQALFEGENDFTLCLRESFPTLKLQHLSRTQWCTIRRLMGRPRRCSQAFFDEERGELAKRRQKIRLVQQRKVNDMSSLCRDLPDLIPMPLVIGTKVTARLRQPQDGLFVGQIDAVDTSNNTYRITFDRQGLGTHSVPDYEVLSNEIVDKISISSLAQRFRPRPAVLPTGSSTSSFTPQQQSSHCLQPIKPSSSNLSLTSLSLSSRSDSSHLDYVKNLVSDPVLGSSNTRFLSNDSSVSSLPVSFLTSLVRLSKVLNLKRDKIIVLREMNTEVERRESVGEPVAQDFQRRYARTVLDLEELNSELNNLLVKVRQQCHEVAPESEQGLSPLAGPDSIRQLCYQEARELVETQIDSRNASHTNVSSNSIVSLVTGLTSLMLQIKCLAESERNAYELQALHDSLEELRTNLHKSNLTSLRNHVLVHIQHIQSGLCNFDSLGTLNTKEGSVPSTNIGKCFSNDTDIL